MDKVNQQLIIDSNARVATATLAKRTENKIYIQPGAVEFEERRDNELHIILKADDELHRTFGDVDLRLIVNKQVMKAIVEKILE